ncbi:hypothetical protein GCM10011402_37290 [Paracoccus acridae]|uniref:Uncharacterized protein n=1 Tax=Paracoccus acridae TaxID=1795310 RepID=A0ABQ1VPC6_9RHOB|nr:hypothetical protein GCM10011402_37290 [Paracoccus acridae]
MAIRFGFPRRMPWVTANGRSYKDVHFAYVEGAVDVGDMGVFNPKTHQVTWMKGGTATCHGYPMGEQGKVDLLMEYLEAEDDQKRDELRPRIYDALGHIQRPDTRPIEDPAERPEISPAKQGASTHVPPAQRRRPGSCPSPSRSPTC